MSNAVYERLEYHAKALENENYHKEAEVLRDAKDYIEAVNRKLVALTNELEQQSKDAEDWRIGAGRSYNQKTVILAIVEWLHQLDPGTIHPEHEKHDAVRYAIARISNEILLKWGGLLDG